jgi:hypothetical protein
MLFQRPLYSVITYLLYCYMVVFSNMPWYQLIALFSVHCGQKKSMKNWPFSEPVRKGKAGKQSFFGVRAEKCPVKRKQLVYAWTESSPIPLVRGSVTPPRHCTILYTSLYMRRATPQLFLSINVMTCGLQVIIYIQQADSELSKKRYIYILYRNPGKT